MWLEEIDKSFVGGRVFVRKNIKKLNIKEKKNNVFVNW